MCDVGHGKLILSRRELVVGLAAGTVVACTTNPATGTSQFIVISDGELAQLSQGAWDDVRSQERVSSDAALNRRLRTVGDRIATAADMDPATFEYAVFDSDTKNAFVLPGRQVGCYRGILDMAESDDELATVIGHEVAHVTGRHAAERYSQNMAVGVGAVIAGFALGQSDSPDKDKVLGVLGLGVTYGVLMPYSRRHETQADQFGLNYMHGAGYQPSQAVSFWRKMAAEGGPRPPEFLSTHPDPATRIRLIEEQIAANGWA
jgi:predicted Zn-dependent protease